MKVIITQRDVPPPVPRPVDSGLVASPGGQDGATELEAKVNILATVAAGTGVKLKNILGGQQTLVNEGAFDVLVFPMKGTGIRNGAIDAPTTLSAGSWATFSYDQDVTWFVTQ